MKIAALYARVSGEQQRDSNTIASQTEALVAYAERHGYRVAPDMVIEDDGLYRRRSRTPGAGAGQGPRRGGAHRGRPGPCPGPL